MQTDGEMERPLRRYELRVDSVAGRMTVVVEAAVWEGPIEDAHAAWAVIADTVADQLKAL